MRRKKTGARGSPVLLSALMLLAATRPSSAGVNTWTSLGPEGGVVRDVAVAPNDPSVLYAATPLRGIWRSIDGGASWSTRNNGLFELDAHSVAFHPTDASILLVGTHSAIYRSTNGGKNWSASLFNVTDVGDIAFDPVNHANVYAAALTGIYKSTDGGVTWVKLDINGLTLWAYAVAVQPSSPNVILAGTSKGLFRSTNHGQTWTGAYATADTVYDIAFAPSAPNVVYIATYVGVFRSSTGGTNWSSIRATGTRAVAVSLDSPNVVYAGWGDLEKSTDGGASWVSSSTGMPLRNLSAIVTDPADPARIYVASTGGGVYRSTDGAATWSTLNHGLVSTQIRTVLVDPTNQSKIYAGTYYGGVYRSIDGGATWELRNQGLGSRLIESLALDPANPATLLLASGNALYASNDEGASWRHVYSDPSYYPAIFVAISPAAPGGVARWHATYRDYYGAHMISSADEGATWTSSGVAIATRYAAIDPNTPGRIYFGGQGIYYHDNAETRARSFGSPPNVSSTGPIAIVPGTPSMLYVAASNGVHHTAMGGVPNWVYTGDSAGALHETTALVSDPTSPPTLFKSDDGAVGPNVERTRNGGAEWNDLDVAPQDVDVRSLAVSTTTFPSMIYAGTMGWGVIVMQFTCGDGIVQAGETCDDGPLAPDLCCSAVCQAAKSYTTCRRSAGTCDPAETCPGASSSVCPADAKRTTTCRGAAGACDVAEFCDGVSNACPANVLVPAGTECRPSIGPCDISDTCTGASGSCPADAVAPAGIECRPAAGNCDIVESCTGGSPACPNDAFQPSGVGCRGSAGVCDVAESCTGNSAACPTDAFRSSSVECRASAGVCDVAESCTGNSADCPADALRPSTFECRGSAGVCDVAETCDGNAACPTDGFRSSSFECRSSAGVCDVAESCVGNSADCPADAFQSSSVECRASAGVCDVAESCSGTGTACPADAFQPGGFECRTATSACDEAERCDGASTSCPADLLQPDGTACDDGDACSPIDSCAAGVCVPDGIVPRCGDGTTCGAEQCDDGNADSGDGCDENCTSTACGNGVLTAGEQCDDGNAAAADGCSGLCRYELIPGNGQGATGSDAKACLLEFFVANPYLEQPLDRRGRPSFEQSCTKGDPSCDFDTDPVSKSCEFRLTVCLNNRDPLLPSCAAVGVDAPIDIRRPNPRQDAANHLALSAALLSLRDPTTGATGLHPPIAAAVTDVCSAPFPIRVPLGGIGGTRRGKLRIRTVARSTSGPRPVIDRDRLTLICEP